MTIDLHAEYAKLAAAIPRPASDHHNRAINPAEQPQLTRYCAIMRHIRNGKTFEEATAYYDRPRGVCECGAKARTQTGRLCTECYNRLQTRRVKEYRAGDRRSVKARKIVDGKRCLCGCGVPLPSGPSKRTPECAARYKAEQDRKRARERYQPKTPRVEPSTRPSKVKQIAQPVPRPVDVTGHIVTRVPSFVPQGLRNLLPDPGERFYTAAD